MNRKHIITAAVSSFLLLSACGGSTPDISAEDKVEIDCLAAKTVKQITDEVSVAIAGGATQDELRSLTDKIITSNAETLKTRFSEDDHNVYHEFESRRRLTAMQNALMNKAPDSPDQKLMDATFELAATCSF